MKKTCLITGAGGFVGAAAVRRFIREGYDVSVLLRGGKHYWRLQDLEGKYRAVTGDLTDASVIDAIASVRPEYVYHFATYGAYPNEQDYAQTVKVNMQGIYHIIEAAKRSGTKLIINTGSSSEYGIKDHPMKETDILVPVNDYGVTKAAATLYCQKEAIQHGVPVITFRLFSVYGSYEEKGRLIPSLMLGALKGTPIALSAPQNTRDYIYLEDVIDAYVKASEAEHTPGAIYNIGTGNEYQTKDVADAVLRISGSRSRLEWGKVEKQSRQMEPKHWRADPDKAYERFGWRARHSLVEGLTASFDWYRKNAHLYE